MVKLFYTNKKKGSYIGCPIDSAYEAISQQGANIFAQIDELRAFRRYFYVCTCGETSGHFKNTIKRFQVCILKTASVFWFHFHNNHQGVVHVGHNHQFLRSPSFLGVVSYADVFTVKPLCVLFYWTNFFFCDKYVGMAEYDQCQPHLCHCHFACIPDHGNEVDVGHIPPLFKFFLSLVCHLFCFQVNFGHVLSRLIVVGVQNFESFIHVRNKFLQFVKLTLIPS